MFRNLKAVIIHVLPGVGSGGGEPEPPHGDPGSGGGPPGLRQPGIPPPASQGSTQSKIGWELTKSGCHVRSPEKKKNTYISNY